MTFEQELESHIPALRRTALRLTRSPAAAEDLVQDAALRALEARSSFSMGTNMAAWLRKILTNLFINGRIKEATHRRILSRIEEDGTGEVLLSGRVMSTEEELSGSAVRTAVRSLPAQYREAVELVDLDGHAYREAAGKMAVPIGTVMSRLHRGRRILASRLEAA